MIDISNWKEFRVGDLFTLERGKCSKVAGLGTGDIPYVGCTNHNNGVLGYYAFDADLISKGNCIVFIGNGNGSAGQQIYKEEDFVSSTGNVIGYRDGLNKYNAGFVVSVMDKIQEVTQKFSHANGRTLDKLSEQIIKLPVTSDGQPDWDYMESYMKAVMEESEANIENLRSANDYRHKIDVSGWGEFHIGDLFSVVKGTRLTKANMKDGNIRFIGSSATNNGWTASISNNEHLHPSNTITVCYNGSVGETFYQDEPFWASDDVNILYPNFLLNREIAMFLCPIIKSAGQKYAFIDKWKQEAMQNEIIKLPITSTGEPDWNYMERYMRDIMAETEQKVLALNM